MHFPTVPAKGHSTVSDATKVLPRCDEALPTGHKPKVLVVDDVAANRLVLQMFLGRHGFHVQLADGGEQAVKLAAEHRFDVILMDIHMPGVDGYTAARRIRAAEPPAQRALILGVTAAIAPDVRTHCLDAGMDEHFSKPLDLRKFCRMVTHLLAARTPPPAAAAAHARH